MDAGTSDSQFLTRASNALNAGRSMPKAVHAQNMRQARKVARDFEAVFIGQMLQPMFQNIDAAAMDIYLNYKHYQGSMNIGAVSARSLAVKSTMRRLTQISPRTIERSSSRERARSSRQVVR